jgi:hypothetical protein
MDICAFLFLNYAKYSTFSLAVVFVIALKNFATAKLQKKSQICKS